MQNSNAIIARNIIQMTDWGGSGTIMKRTQNAIESELKKNGYQIFRPRIKEFIFDKEISKAVEELSEDAFASLFFSALNIHVLFDQLDSSLFPNPIILTHGPELQLFEGKYKACVIIYVEWWGEKIPELVENVGKALKYLEAKKERAYPVIGANFRKTDFGWVRNPIVDNPYAETVWDRFHENVGRGSIFILHSAEARPQDVMFSIYDMSEGYFKVQILDHEPGELDVLSTSRNVRYTLSPPNMLTDPVEIYSITKAEFLTISLLFKDFSVGRISRQKLFEATEHAAFLIGIYNWLSSENLLGNGPSEKQ